MPEVLSVPIPPGMHQEADRTMLPAGAIVSASNVRVRKGGALSKRSPTVAAGLDVAGFTKSDGTAGTGNPITAYVGEIAELNDGSQVLIADNRCYVRKSTGDEWVESGRTSRALPVSSKWVQYNENVTPGTGALIYGTGTVSTAVQGDYIAVSYAEHVSRGGISITQCCLKLYGKNGVVIDTYVRGEMRDYPEGRQNPRVLAADGVFLWLYQRANGTSSDADIYVSRLDPVAKTLSAENAFVSTPFAGNGYDAVSYNNGTEVLVVRRKSFGTFEVMRCDASQSNTIPGGGSWYTLAARSYSGPDDATDVILTVYGDAAMTQIWVGYVTKLGTIAARAIGYDGLLASAPSSDTALSAIAGGTLVVGQLGFASKGTASSHVWVMVSSKFTLNSVRPVFQTMLYECQLGTGTNPISALTSLPHMLPASRPFFGMTTSFMCWLHDDGTISGYDNFQENSFAWRNQRGYGLYTVTFGVDSFGDPNFVMLQPELIPDERSTLRGMSPWLPQVALRDVIDDNGVSTAHALVPLLAPIQTAALSDAESWAVVLFEWETDIELMSRRRQIVEHAGAALILGGHLQENAFDNSNRQIPSHSGSQLSLEITAPRGFENGFVRGPALLDRDTPNDLSGALVAGAIYQICGLYEQVDAVGRRHRSRPSNIVRITAPDTTSALAAQIAVCDLSDRAIASDAHQAVVHFFATQGDKSTFYRITPSSGAPLAVDGGSSMTAGFITAGLADAAIAAGEPLYTEGNVIPNMPAPAHRFGTVGAGRVWLGGLFDPRVIECSKLELPREPTQFTRHPAFRQYLPDPCTGLAYLDGNLVAFTRTGIYTLPASVAPNNQGSPALPQFQPLPSSIGCINPWSVKVVADGVLFQSRRGLYILPRGFGRPELISEQVQDEIKGRLVTSTAVVDHEEQLLVLSCIPATGIGENDGRLLVYDLDRRQWISTDDPSTGSEWGALVTSWNGKLALATRYQFGDPVDLRVEDPDAWSTNLSNQDVVLDLADLRAFGVMNRGMARVLHVMGEIRGNSTISATISTDGLYSQAIDLPPQQVRGQAGDKFTIAWGLPVRDLTAVGVKLTVSPPDDGEINEGLVIHSIGVEADGLPTKPRVPSERRA